MPARGRIAGLVLLACAARSAPAAAVSFTLTEREQAEAIHVGERSALQQPDGRYLARSGYGFSTATLGTTAGVVLVVRDADGNEVARFPVDLASIR